MAFGESHLPDFKLQMRFSFFTALCRVTQSKTTGNIRCLPFYVIFSQAGR